jgi:hypothetical protein
MTCINRMRIGDFEGDGVSYICLLVAPCLRNKLAQSGKLRFVIRRYPIRIPAWTSTILTEVFHCFLSPSRQISVYCFKVGQHRFLPYYYQLTSNHTTLYTLRSNVRYCAILKQLLIFWTLSIVLFVYLKQRFGNWTLPLSSGEKPTQLGPIDRASPYLRRYGIALSIGPNSGGVLPEDGGRVQSPKRVTINKKISSEKNSSPTFIDTTRATLKTSPKILLLLRVYSLPR